MSRTPLARTRALLALLSWDNDNMLSFKEYNQSLLTEASIRQGLPHITTMDHNQTAALVKTGKVHLANMTEKTDGTVGVIGHDELGPYTQSTGSGSEKMRSPEDYHRRVLEQANKKGVEPNYTAANAFGAFHQAFLANAPLQNHLRDQFNKTGQDTRVKGEIFHRRFEKPGDTPEERKYVATSYNPSRFGSTAHFVIHTKLPENQGHDPEHFKNNLSDHAITFDDDKINHPVRNVDVRDEAAEVRNLNHGLLSERTKPSNKDAKLAEQDKLKNIQQRISDKVDTAIKKMNLSPKWGTGTEGSVVHPSASNPEAPRFKVTSDAFRDYRASDAANWKK